jgi:hypothetical protein
VAEILAENERCLVVGRPTNLRKWFATRLGRAAARTPGVRPPTDLSGVARALRFAPARSGFEQRMTFERLMTRRFPGVPRKDLKPPAYLHLDPSERFPRATVHAGGGGRPGYFGPFRGRPSAEKALSALHKLFPLRPCDFRFEPAPDLPLGVGCLYAQVRSCAAPCLCRIGEDDYRGLARDAARLLARPSARPEDAAWAPRFVASAAARALVAEPVKGGVDLYPVRAGAVGAATRAAADGLSEAFSALRWDEPEAPGRDEAWLASWLYEKKRKGLYAVFEDDDGESAREAVLQSLICWAR